jgi:hypothetical protein
MGKVQVEILQEQVPAGLSAGELVRLLEVREILMVREDCDNMGGAQEVMPPFLQGMDDSEQLAVIDVIVPFCGTQRFGQICTRMQVPIGVPLHQHGPSRSERGIGHDKERGGDIGHGKHRLTGKGVLDGEEGILTGRGRSQQAFFLVRSWRGRAMLEKSGMNRR